MSILSQRVVIFIFLFATSIFSDAQNYLVINKLTFEPQLDGDLFEPAWAEVDACSMVMMYPESGKMPSQKTEFKIGYTGQYLYVAGFMYDTQPEGIRAASRKRDDTSLSNDWFAICLDTYNDNENAVCFATNPAELRLDAQIINDGEGNFFQTDWNTVWEVKTMTTDQGWFAEMRIPLSSLRYVIIEDKVTMGLLAWRYISRLNEGISYPSISNEWGFYSWAKPSQFEDVVLTGINSVNPLYFSPYLLGGLEQKTSLNEAEDTYETKTSWERQAGIDIKYGLSKNFTLDLTVNTDFAQVEADEQQVNLTRFSLFFPEKRQFFLERSGIFDFTFGSTGQLFYSRRIGIDDGQKVPIWGGGRLTGRANNWDIGFMSLQTGNLKDDETDEKILRTTNNSVFRLRRKIALNTNSYLGGLVTSKIDAHGNYNIGYGVDAILNLFGNDYLNVALARTHDTINKGDDLLDPSKFFIQWERRTYKGLSYIVNYARAGNRYNPELGFEYRKDFSRYSATLGYGWIPGEKSKILKQHKIAFNSFVYLKNVNDQVESIRITPSYQFSTKRDHNFAVSTLAYYESIAEDFDLSPDVSVPEGNYSFFEFALDYSSPYGEIFSWEASFSSGKYYDGWKNSLAASSSVKLGESWNINLGYQINQIHFNEREQQFLSQLGSIRILYMYSIATSASSYLQYNSLTNRFIWNVRFRYNPKEGNDFYIVYNDNINDERSKEQPELPFSNQRTILLKYTHTFRVR